MHNYLLIGKASDKRAGAQMKMSHNLYNLCNKVFLNSATGQGMQLHNII